MQTNGDVFAGYVIERLLGRGGMGQVYLAKHPRLPRMTALKLLNREMVSDHEIRARFEREADLVAQLDHPNIVTVYDRGLEDGQLWISMQFIDGIDAASVDPKRLPPERAVQIIAEVAEALDYAHRNGVLHRDVKPANMLLARSTGGKGERVYLTDFGIARLRDDGGHLTQTGTFTATLAYASPEQLTGASLDGRADQYSLACSLFWLLTGSGPFSAPNPAAVIRGHLQSPPPTLSSVRSGLPPALDGVLVKAMSKRPDERFGTCAEFAAAARRALAQSSAPHVQVAPRPATGPSMPTIGMPTHGMPSTGPGHGIPSTGPGHGIPSTGPGHGIPSTGPGHGIPSTGPGHGIPSTGPGHGIPSTGPGHGIPSTGPGHSVAPRPSTGPANPIAPRPMTGPGNPIPQPMRPPTPAAQPVYQSAPRYPQPQSGGSYYQPRPAPQRRKSNGGLIIGIIAVVVVLLLIVLAIIGAMSNGGQSASLNHPGVTPALTHQPEPRPLN
ncbi:serine/threonine-protein kinase [Nocardia aurantia]|uniref:non-specific serine/threonine protein kinase n=1 Tax=Nocardia aurantia TaxID=2585199 RepID=A0A7K0DQV5_9NOCA|nr:serine/threonine protein kinase [Nocardia aurantia]MQY28153.1 Serine/threonine-protein kinase PknD [Nocardia aurantia]